MLGFVPYRKEHAMVMDAIEPGGDLSIFAFRERHPATTAVNEDGKPIVCFGVTPYWEGMVEVWAVFDEDAKKEVRDIVKYTHAFFDDLSQRFRRIQADVVDGNETAIRFVEHFGFKREGVMRKYSPLGEDVIRYARVSA